ncbi:MAG: hypothetical protein IH845_00760 [Nanoarchaeota archaeon]|nr:hypothetical protein [Nanoarchaeota archaeon]
MRRELRANENVALAIQIAGLSCAKLGRGALTEFKVKELHTNGDHRNKGKKPQSPKLLNGTKFLQINVYGTTSQTREEILFSVVFPFSTNLTDQFVVIERLENERLENHFWGITNDGISIKTEEEMRMEGYEV